MAKWVTLKKKLVTLRNMGRIWPNGSHLKIMGDSYKIDRTLKYRSHWANWVAFGQMGYTWKNGLHLKIMDHTYKICRTWKYGLDWASWPDFKIMGET